MASCRKKKSDDASFLQDVRGSTRLASRSPCKRFGELHAMTVLWGYELARPMNSVICLQMFEMAKNVGRRSAGESKEVESVLPLQTSVAQYKPF